MTFFFKHKVIYPHQFTFQSKISTSHAMLDLVTAAYDNIDLNLHTGLVLIDFKKAFDTVCHKILLNKLAYYGIRGVAFKLLSSYLTYQKQFVNFNGLHYELRHKIRCTSRILPWSVTFSHICKQLTKCC